jgi:hypothetical protein
MSEITQYDVVAGVEEMSLCVDVDRLHVKRMTWVGFTYIIKKTD